MSWSLFDAKGQRKYLTPTERAAFIRAAFKAEPTTSSFCLTLALTGARISEALALTPDRLDASDNVIVLETLKRRRKGLFRAVPVPQELLSYLGAVHDLPRHAANDRLWNFSRPTAWKRVKGIMTTAGIGPSQAKPKALRHTFAVEAVRQRIALSLIKKWLGHAKIETTALYAAPVGDEERALARLMWQAMSLDGQFDPRRTPARRSRA
ncbi:MAG TPA: tyrosine-type recombinase/integrase [Candidatus Binatia bacterium]|nr:tyrosine-type recombinase/integrase [Candidatus Binatia bacterium]